MKTHHGEIGQLKAPEVLKVIERGQLAHLGCHYKNEIYVVPITYVFDDGYIIGHSKLGKKIELMRKNPKICIQVEEVETYFQWKSVIAWGEYEELRGAEASKAMRLLVKTIAQNEGITKASSLEVDLTAMLEKAIIFRMKVERSTGRFESQEMGK